MSRRQKQNMRVFAWLAVLAMLLRVLVPIVCHPQSASAGSLDEISSQLVMCLAHDAPGASPAPDKHGPDKPAPGKPGPSQPAAEHCLACALAHALVLLTVIALAIFAARGRGRICAQWRRAAADLLPDHMRSGALHSRAPPLPA
jgi:hypothetical protein